MLVFCNRVKQVSKVSVFVLRFVFTYFQREGKGRKRGRETHAREASIGCLLYTSNRVPGLQPRHIPLTRIKPAVSSSQVGAKSTEPHQPGHGCFFIQTAQGQFLYILQHMTHSFIKYSSYTFRTINPTTNYKDHTEVNYET